MEHTKSSISLPKGKVKLITVLQNSGDLITNKDVSRSLGMSYHDASKLLSRWARQGWLRRVASGSYAAVPIDSLDSLYVLEDPWVIVPELPGRSCTAFRVIRETPAFNR